MTPPRHQHPPATTTPHSTGTNTTTIKTFGTSKKNLKKMTIPKPCLTCGTTTTNGSRCPECESERQAQRNRKRTHYQGDYKQRAKHIRQTAVICWICKEPPRPNDPWQADHIDPANPNSPLAPAHRSCNIKRRFNP